MKCKYCEFTYETEPYYTNHLLEHLIDLANYTMSKEILSRILSR